MPISIIRIWVLSPVGMIWLESVVRPNAANTEVRPSSTGMPAASRAPNATIRMISVIGMDSISAFWKSEASLSSNALPDVASPKPSISRDGCAATTALVAASIGATLSVASFGSPLTVNGRRAARPFAAGSTGPISPTTPVASSRFVASATTGASASSVSLPDRLWMRSDSSAGWSSSVNAWSSTLVARPDSPTPVSARSSVSAVIELPMTKAIATKATHPMIANHGCMPLQRPIR